MFGTSNLKDVRRGVVQDQLEKTVAYMRPTKMQDINGDDDDED